MTKTYDENFVEKLMKTLDISKEDVYSLLDDLEINQINELSHAVVTNDRQTINKIYSSVVKPMKEHLNIGSLVSYKDQKVRVKIPHGPGNTVGILIGDKLKMVNRDKVSLAEDFANGVLGLANVPPLDVARMQELAGISVEKPMMNTAPQMEEDHHDEWTQCAFDAVDALEQVIPNMLFKDVKLVRARLQRILTSLNETEIPNQRKLKP